VLVDTGRLEARDLTRSLETSDRQVNKRDNPYTPGAGRKPPVLAGRDPDLENVQALIERLSGGGYERSLVYSGLRGVGKTVLLMEFDVLASEAGWATTDVYAWWVAAPAQGTNTPFSINHATGTTVVTRNQQVNGGIWVLLGTFNIGPGDYVQVNDNANGYVVADAILLDPN
jgi:hypothetical protein